jgi:deoxyribodipyrimidine photolyase
MKPPVNIMWFRRDLRLNDNAALYHALKAITRLFLSLCLIRISLRNLKVKPTAV